jgi:hydroxyisourate hydrolase
MRSPITTHILDTALGRPAAGVPVRLDRLDTEWHTLAAARTDSDGRVADLLAPGSLTPGTYRMYFDTAAYWSDQGSEGFYPYVEIVFSVQSTDEHYHVPLLLNPYGYSTYRGS